MTKTTTTCDVCGAEKRQVNRWWVVNIPGGSSRTFYAMPWDSAREEEINQGKHACSRNCAQKLFEWWMGHMEVKTA